MPSFFMRYWRVERLRPRRSAALPLPPTFQPLVQDDADVSPLHLGEARFRRDRRRDGRSVEEDRVGGQGGPARHDEGSLDHVLQLAHVAGPGVGDERRGYLVESNPGHYDAVETTAGSYRGTDSALCTGASVGRETVTYESNISKYYTAYRLIEEERARREEAKRAIRPGAR
jgi:hypothetical protein